MIGNERHNGKAPNVAASVSDLTHDVIELSELQVQLLTLDLKRSVEEARLSIGLAAVGACLLLGTVPVALLALAELMIQQFEWSRAGSLGFATLVGLVLATVIVGIAWWHIKKGMMSLQRSREELSRNITWLKSTLRTRGQAQAAAEKPLNF